MVIKINNCSNLKQTEIHERDLQKIIEDEVIYLYEEVLGEEAPFQVHVFIQDMRWTTAMGYDPKRSDPSHIYLFLNTRTVKDYLNDKDKESDFRFFLLHELVHSADVAAIKKQCDYIDVVRSSRDTRFSYTRLLWPLRVLDLYRSEGVAELCSHILLRSPAESANLGVFASIMGYGNYRDFGKNLEKMIDHWSYEGESIYREMEKWVYTHASSGILMDVLTRLGLVTESTRYDWSHGCLKKEEKAELLKTCISLSLSQYIAGLMTINWEGESSVPIQKLLGMCASVQKRMELDKISLYTLLVETQYPSATDFIEVLGELMEKRTLDVVIESKIKALHDNFTKTDAGMLDLVDKLWDFYVQNREGLYQTYATAAKMVLDYFFYEDDLIQDDMVGFGRADDIALMTKMWKLVQYEVYTTYLRFELNDMGTGLVVTGSSRWEADEDGYYIEPLNEVQDDVLYIPAYHEFEGQMYPVVEIRDGAGIGDDYTKAVFISQNVKYIGERVFYIYSLDPFLSMVVDKRNPYYDSRQKCNGIIETATNRLIYGCANTVVPYSVASIAEGAMDYATGIYVKDTDSHYLVIPDSVTEIDESAFAKCWVRRIYISDPSLIKKHRSYTEIVKL